MRAISLFLLSLLCVPAAFATEAAPNIMELIAQNTALIEANHASQQDTLNHMWTMIAAALVLFMQGGFLLLEAGMVRSKNSINVAQKNIIDFVFAVLIFYAIGFAMMFGTTYGGFIGWSSDLAFFDTTDDWNYTFFVFQAVFAGTAGTIVSGAVAERMKLSGYIWITFAIAAVIYPVIGHWGWGNLLNGDNETYLINNGFIDFAGSTIVHSVGGWVALAACIVVGARIGRYNENGKIQRVDGHSLVLSTMGCIILWVGWIGFNGGSTTVGSPEFAHIVFNTIIASIFGGAVALTIGRIDDGYFRPDQAINGILGGLVAITAGCDAVTGWGAAIIGGSAGLVMHFAWIALVRNLKIDDVVGAIPVHGVCGAWGTIVLAFFATEEKLGGATRMEQLWVQTQGVGMAFIWAFGVTYILCKFLDKTIGLRVSPEEELAGLNIAEHNATLGTGALQQCLKDVVEGTRDLTKRIDLEAGDESAEVAAYINQFIGQMQGMMHGIHDEANKLDEHSQKMEEISNALASSSDTISDKSAEVTATNREMVQDVNDIAGLVDGIDGRISDIAGNATAMANNMENVSQAIYSLTDSISSIAKRSTSASSISTEASDLTKSGIATVETLTEATRKIGEVVDFIKKIANQTNLLALNASIEASRAGEAGKGFAVVAAEVKTLAAETARATEEIEQRIKGIQLSSGDVSSTMGDVTSIMEKINEEVANISALAGKQSETAANIAQNVSTSQKDSQQVSETIQNMSTDVKEIATRARNTAQSADTVHQSMESFSEESRKSHAHATSSNERSNEVRNVSSKLSEAIGQYKIDSDDDENNDPLKKTDKE